MLPIQKNKDISLYFISQLISFKPTYFNILLVLENGRVPKKPLFAENGEG